MHFGTKSTLKNNRNHIPKQDKIYNESIKISCICLEILCIQLYAYYLLNNLYHLFRKDT
jgi:hypothetical protein